METESKKRHKNKITKSHGWTKVVIEQLFSSCQITRMTTFIKTKFNKSDDQTNIDNIELLLILN